MSLDRSIRVLVVDDDVDDLYLINEALSEVANTRYNVTTATSSLAAMALLSKATFDVVFSDYRLGHLTGVDFIHSMRSASIETPVILLTGINDEGIDNAALRAGASDFVPKTSINPDVLDRSVRYALAHSERQRLLQTVLKSTTSAVLVFDSDGKINLWNPRSIDFAKAAFGETPNRLEQLAAMIRCASEKDIRVGDRIVEATITELSGGGSVMALHDVTARVNELQARERAEQEIRKVAMQDVLTGLPNRMAFNAHLDASIKKARENASPVALLSFDFNRFKEVNDMLGHAAGDHLLKLTAERLRSILREGEYAARLGGDEFVLVQEATDEAKALQLADKISTALSMPLEWEGRTFESSVSVGIALYPLHGSNREQLLANADLAMYRSKSNASKRVSLYDFSMDQVERNRRKIAIDLKAALYGEKLTLHFQPQFSTVCGKISGFEALLRWRREDGSFVPPSEFIPIAEENGLIYEIDRWVLRKACSLVAQWPKMPRIAVNISAKAIGNADVCSNIRSILLASGVAASRLELEVTETALIHDLNRGLHNLRQLKALGISVAMDDFGIGYSSLSLLNAFPFDRIKIDRSFIEVAGSNVRADAIFQTIIGLGTALNVPVLAEGVETEDQLSFAATANCQEVQGFYFGKPMSIEELGEFFSQDNADVSLERFKAWRQADRLNIASA